ncbi:hypothetical protein FRZ03_24035 [Streptomyces misionensis]|uniref:Secreted protein n=1 Tax=Streptomyces misionensis TaxID=67331 RepID=A0A5C6JDE9_9ACTN|nr:hypothetical protein [Streptomyces misionensis]TWV39568.1 hypothetical protein FRZ03_24035 [Streptomyces misionensis]
MRLSRSLAPLTMAAALVLSLPYDATPHARASAGAPQPFGAACRTAVTGSHVVAYCHNPYVDTDRLRLHIACARWWDIDTDSAPVDAEPARTVRLTGRCWKEVGSAWISHQKVR